jgi:site-specific recombinase XerD
VKPRLTATTSDLKIETFLTRLAAQGAAASNQNQAFNSLLFFYREVLKSELESVQALRARPSVTLRECPTTDEVTRLLAAVRDVHGYPNRLLVHLPYACGLRVTEPLNLRIKDLDLANSRLDIRQAKWALVSAVFRRPSTSGNHVEGTAAWTAEGTGPR